MPEANGNSTPARLGRFKGKAHRYKYLIDDDSVPEEANDTGMDIGGRHRHA